MWHKARAGLSGESWDSHIRPHLHGQIYVQQVQVRASALAKGSQHGLGCNCGAQKVSKRNQRAHLSHNHTRTGMHANRHTEIICAAHAGYNSRQRCRVPPWLLRDGRTFIECACAIAT